MMWRPGVDIFNRSRPRRIVKSIRPLTCSVQTRYCTKETSIRGLMQVAWPNFQNPAQGVLRRRTNAWPCLFQIQRSPMVLPAVPWHPLRAPLAWDCAPRRPVATWQFPRDCAERLLVHGVPDDDLLHSARCQPPRMFGQPDQHHGSGVRGWCCGGEKQNCQRKLTLGPNLPAARFPGMPSVRWGKTHACPCAVQHSCTCAQT